MIRPRLSCIYCGERIVMVYDPTHGHWKWPSPLACGKHADLPALDPRWRDAA